jgi:hypothetical protein
MKVDGVEISQDVIDVAVADVFRASGGFTFLNLQGALGRAGVDDRSAYRCADRTLQKLRKAGRIVFFNGRWFQRMTEPELVTALDALNAPSQATAA